ncbi:uncharacterized protein LOC144158816 [Haemaphysalis longicornis]
MSAANNVEKDMRRQLMAACKKILYATDQEQLEAAIENLRTLPHQEYIKRVKKFLGCQEEWVVMHRAGLMTRGHNTNNYSESSMRILKDIVLCRKKAYNAVALTEYTAVEWEEYFEKGSSAMPTTGRSLTGSAMST